MGKKKKNGPYKKSSWTSHLGRLTEKGNLKNGKLDGVFEIYYDNGQLYTRGNYTDGIPVGLWEYFHDSGLLQRKTHYNEQGAEDYYFEENYHENGKLADTGYYKNAESDVQFDGLHKTFYENGQVSMRRWYNDNQPLGDSEYFDKDGVPIDSDEYFSYQAELEEERAVEELEMTSEEFYVEHFLVVASYYVFHADNEFPDPKWGEKTRRPTSFIKELYRWRQVCGEERVDAFQRDYVLAGIDSNPENSEDYEFQGYPTYEQKIAYLKEELVQAATAMNEAGEESRASALKTELLKIFAIGQIIHITYASGFISDLEMAALHAVAELIALDRDQVQDFLDNELDSSD